MKGEPGRSTAANTVTPGMAWMVRISVWPIRPAAPTTTSFMSVPLMPFPQISVSASATGLRSRRALQIVQASVEAVTALCKRLMRAFLGDDPVLHDDDLVGIDDGRRRRWAITTTVRPLMA